MVDGAAVAKGQWICHGAGIVAPFPAGGVGRWRYGDSSGGVGNGNFRQSRRGGIAAHGGADGVRFQTHAAQTVGVQQAVFLALQMTQGITRRYIPHRARAARPQQTPGVHRIVRRRQAGPAQYRSRHGAGVHPAGGQHPKQPDAVQPFHHIGSSDAANAGLMFRFNRADAAEEQAAAGAETAPAVVRIAKPVPEAMPPGVRRVGDTAGGQDFPPHQAGGVQVGGEHPHLGGGLRDFQLVPLAGGQGGAGGQSRDAPAVHPFQQGVGAAEPQAQAVVGRSAAQDQAAPPAAAPPIPNQQRRQRVAGIQRGHGVGGTPAPGYAADCALLDGKAVAGGG